MGVSVVGLTMLVIRVAFGRVQAPSPSQGVCSNPPTVSNVSLEAYSGVWYEIGSTALVKARIERDLICATARYSVIPDGDLAGSIRVRNEGYNIRTGEFAHAIGTATVVSPGRLEVKFFPGAPGGDYRIIYLSGKAEDKYNVAIVYSCDESVPGGSQSLFILSREPELDDEDDDDDDYDDDDETLSRLLNFVRDLGIVFEPNNEFILTPQDPITCGRNGYDD